MTKSTLYIYYLRGAGCDATHLPVCLCVCVCEVTHLSVCVCDVTHLSVCVCVCDVTHLSRLVPRLRSCSFVKFECTVAT